jgi:hypothetical protein
MAFAATGFIRPSAKITAPAIIDIFAATMNLHVASEAPGHHGNV